MAFPFTQFTNDPLNVASALHWYSVVFAGECRQRIKDNDDDDVNDDHLGTFVHWIKSANKMLPLPFSGLIASPFINLWRPEQGRHGVACVKQDESEWIRRRATIKCIRLRSFWFKIWAATLFFLSFFLDFWHRRRMWNDPTRRNAARRHVICRRRRRRRSNNSDSHWSWLFSKLPFRFHGPSPNIFPYTIPLLVIISSRLHQWIEEEEEITRLQWNILIIIRNELTVVLKNQGGKDVPFGGDWPR